MKLPDGYTPGVGVVKASGFGGLGERILTKFGWKEGRGLGKEGQGMVEAIEVRQKDDAGGVGAGPVRNFDKWWESAYEAAARGVRVDRAGGASSASSGSDSDSESDSDSDSDGGLRSRVRSINRDGTLASGSVDELKLLERLSKSGGRVAAGRFGGRDAKMERIRRQEAEEAARMREKLGLQDMKVGTSGEEGGKARAKRPKKRKASDGDRDERETPEKKGKKGKKEKKGKKKEKKEKKSAGRRIVIECGDQSAADEFIRAACSLTPTSGWWGCKRFTSAGALDSSPLKKVKEDRGFSEDQQAKIYETAQCTKASGKRGLGGGKPGRGAIKVDGAVWEGTKVTFGDDDDGKTETIGRIRWERVVKKALKGIKKKKSSSSSKKKKEKEKEKGGVKIKAVHKAAQSFVVAEYSVVLDASLVKAEVDRCIKASFETSACGKYISL